MESLEFIAFHWCICITLLNANKCCTNFLKQKIQILTELSWHFIQLQFTREGDWFFWINLKYYCPVCTIINTNGPMTPCKRDLGQNPGLWFLPSQSCCEYLSVLICIERLLHFSDTIYITVNIDKHFGSESTVLDINSAVIYKLGCS